MASQRREWGMTLENGLKLVEKAGNAGKSKRALASMDPMLLAGIVYQMAEEKRSMNLLLKRMQDKLESLEKKMGNARQKVLLPEVDEKILSFVKKNKGRANAEEVQRQMKYKGRNAASSRLNKLVSKGILAKQQVGRKVYFLLYENYAP